jgi:hypothetical protein
MSVFENILRNTVDTEEIKIEDINQVKDVSETLTIVLWKLIRFLNNFDQQLVNIKENSSYVSLYRYNNNGFTFLHSICDVDKKAPKINVKNKLDLVNIDDVTFNNSEVIFLRDICDRLQNIMLFQDVNINTMKEPLQLGTVFETLYNHTIKSNNNKNENN